MNIQDLIEERNSKKRYETSKMEAYEIFEKQQKAVNNIRSTDGFAEIKMFFTRIVESAQMRLMSCKGEDIKYVQAEMKLAIDFLQFLENLKN